jgi:MraZ protein
MEEVNVSVSALQTYGFFDCHTHSVDEKGRIIIPTAYRDALGETFSIGPTRDFDGIALYPTAVYDQILMELSSLNQRKPYVQQYTMQFYKLSNRNMQKDGQGRILLPQKLRQRFLENASEVEISGGNNFIRILAAGKAMEIENKFYENLPTILEQMGNSEP